MRTRLAILVLLAVGLPVHGQQEGSQAAANQNGSGGVHAPSTPAKAISCKIEQNGTTIECQYPETAAKSYFGRLVSAENLPNLLLIGVGIGAIGAAIKTLREVKRQADLMAEQLTASRQKERARLRIELEPMDLIFTENPDLIPIGAKVENYGGSAAFVSATMFGCWVDRTVNPEEKIHQGVAMNLPEVLSPGGTSYDPVLILPDETEVANLSAWFAEDPRIEGIRKGENSVYLSGFIHYENVFGEMWSLGFKRKFTVYHHSKDFCLGRWTREGKDDNYERQELPKPN